MKVLFLEIDTEEEWTIASIGPAVIASFLREHGHTVSLLRIPFKQQLEQVTTAISLENPALIGVSLTSRQWLRAQEIIARVRKKINIPVIAGGLFPTFSPETVLNAPGFDFVCLGEGERAMLDTLAVLERKGQVLPGEIKNIQVRGGSSPELGPPIADLDSLPFMARDFLGEQYGVFHLLSQRGCPFSCSYCAGAILKNLYSQQNYTRRRSVASLVSEIQALRENGPVNYLIFLDDTFTVHTTWLKVFCQNFKELGIGFSINGRVETVTPKIVEELAEAGCKHMIFGVESGSYRVRKEIMNRPLTDQQIVDAFKMSIDAGILTTANYMMGLPGETKDDIEMTLALNEKLKPHDFGYFVFYPYPGTKLFQVCGEKGYLPANHLALPANNRESILNLPDLPRADIASYYDMFTAAREANHLRQYGKMLDEVQRAEVRKEMQRSAGKG